MSADTAPIVLPAENPYVGPRAFRRDEHLPNRQHVARELADLVIAERIVLLHAPSGAGKTSLIQAAVARMLRSDGFLPTTPARVDKPAPARGNRYVHSIGVDLLGAETPGLDDLTVGEIVERLEPPLLEGTARVLVIDQLEEILTLDPTDRDATEEFFRQLGAALSDGTLFALLAVREDYMGGLDRYLRFLPGRLRARFRLDFLDHDEALAAVRRPAAEQRVSFVDGAAEKLVDRLARARVDRPDGSDHWLRSPYVEPFQLQVVCRTLWRITAAQCENFDEIGMGDVERVDIDRALSRYYGNALAELERELGVDQRAVREWFEDELITARRFRAQTTDPPVPGELGVRVLDALEDAYLIRADTRAGTTWYELAHDRLITAVIDANQAWRHATLEPWQVAAYDWHRNHRQSAFLLTGDALRLAPRPAATGLADVEREFLLRSFDEAGLASARGATSRLALLAAAEAVVIVVLTVLLVVLT
ncbi:ATP-binding protein [Actinokineospora xionganensis]|uniref:ATP-binding protein n=1 Tax=Actinokineospora xionganensis TaxID=2684470 RepID=UPI001FE2ED91|nr:ATP-binding protein [Actinokineospora xionganensis]